MSDASDFAALQRLTPAEAVAYLQARGKLTQTFNWQDLWEQEHTRAFTISRLAHADLLQTFSDKITASVQGDLSRADFMRDMKGALAKAGWWGEKQVNDPLTGELVTTTFNPSRLKLIYDTNIRTAHAAGRWQRFEASRATHPYIRYVTKRDERVRASHAAFDGVTLPLADAFWNSHTPPLGYRCRCRLVAVNQRDYDKGTTPTGGAMRKTAPNLGTQEFVNTRTGEVSRVPVGITPGFGYNPGKAAMVNQNMLGMAKQKLAVLDPDLANAARRNSVTPLGVGLHVLDSWAGMGQRPGLFDLPPTPVIEVPEDAFGGALGKVALAKAADAALRQMQKVGGLSNDDSGWLLRINNKARKKMGDNKDQTTVDSKAVAALEALAKYAVIGERHGDIKHENNKVNAIYRMFSALRIAGRLYRVQLTIKDYDLPDSPHKLHSLDSFEIENAALGTLPPTTSNPDAEQGAQPTTRRTISIEELMRGAKRNNGSIYEK